MKAPVYSEAVLRLMNMTDDMVYAKDIAKVVGMRPDVIIKKAKSGTWPREICNYLESENGNSVKFFRVDLLRKGGWIHDEPDDYKDLSDLRDGVMLVMDAQKHILEWQKNIVEMLNKISENQVMQSSLFRTFVDSLIMIKTKPAGSGN